MMPLDDIIRQIMKQTGKSADDAAKIARVAELRAMKAAKKPTTRAAGGIKIEKPTPVKPKATPKVTPKAKPEPKPYSPGPKQTRSMANKQAAHERYVAQLDRHIANAESRSTRAALEKSKSDYLKKYKAQQAAKVKNITAHQAKAEKKAAARAARKK